jgi:hypothetical protein
VEQARSELEVIRRQTSRPINVNFFCHQRPRVDPAREVIWRQRLDAYFVELGLDNNAAIPSGNRAPFDDKMCDLVAEFHPEVVSFHFGLPDKNLFARVRRAGAKIISSATSVDEARWLEITDVTQLSRRVMRQVGIGASSSHRMFLPRSAPWHSCRRSSMLDIGLVTKKCLCFTKLQN